MSKKNIIIACKRLKKLELLLEIKPTKGLSSLCFGATMEDSEKIFGKAEEIQLLDDIEDFQSIVWHYWNHGFSLFFDEKGYPHFSCVEITNENVILWGEQIFRLNEQGIIELFKKNGLSNFETEDHPWGERRLTFDEVNVDFYFEKNQLMSINYCKLETPNLLIHLN